jgi:hypothetical protein
VDLHQRLAPQSAPDERSRPRTEETVVRIRTLEAVSGCPFRKREGRGNHWLGLVGRHLAAALQASLVTVHGLNPFVYCCTPQNEL